MPPGFRSIVLDQVGSTNTEAFARAREGEPGPLWILALRQVKGRGRSGRIWTSEAGNFHASLLQTLTGAQKVIHQLPLVAGVGTIDAIRAAAGSSTIGQLRLKWPNDILIGKAKCAGILAESQTGITGSEVTAVIGIGINLAWHPADLGRPATHLAAHGLHLSPELMLRHVAQAMQHWCAVWDLGAGFADIRAAWLERAGPVGESVTIDTGKERIAGTFLGLDPEGALLIQDVDGNDRKVAFGDVTLGGASPEAGG